MSGMNKLMMAALVVVVSACTSPDRFGTDGAGGGATGGAAGDPTSPSYFQSTVGDRVLFQVDQSSLHPEAELVLRAQASWLASNAGYGAVIEGHADEQGTREYNLALGARRANAVKEYLVSQGVAENRLRTVTFGKERPLEVCSSESCYSKNRRGVTVLKPGA
ncbi:MAG: peptidoglycan-associated lipoprotein Pal [Halocynthiibacter sp.]